MIVSVDCGIRAGEAARRARALGVDLIITDHHEPEGTLPDALAVINPKRPDCTYPDKYLAGVGVALKVVQALITRADKAQSMSVARAIGFWGSLAGAFFIKGPLAFFIVFAVVGWDAWQNRSAATLRSTRPLAGIISLALLIGGWLTMQSQIHGDDFVKGLQVA